MNRALLLIAVLATAAAHAQEGRGFAEVRATLFPGAAGDKLQLVERVRPTLHTSLSDRVKLVATVEAGFSQGRRTELEVERALRASGLGTVVDAGLCCTPQWRNEGLRISNASDYLDVDRLYLDIYSDNLDLRVGRQAINWGSAQFFNPTDPFPEVLLAEPWRPRRGVNAARVTLPFGEMNDLSAVLAGNDALDELRAAARVRFNFSGTDVAFVGAFRGADRALVGVDLRGTHLVGWWVEAAFLPGEDAHEEVAIGVDYSFPVLERAVLFAQYYRNGAGTSDALAAPGGLVGLGGLSLAPEAPGEGVDLDARPDPFAPFVRGRDYLLLGASLGVTPDLGINLAALQNLNDGSGFVVPTVSYTLLDWLDASVSAQVPYALTSAGGEFKPRPEDLRLTGDLPPPLGPVTLDLSGLVPAATVTAWTRASF